MKKIKLHGKLANGAEAMVDEEDFALLNRFRWSLDSDGYAVSAGYRYKMHRIITAAPKKRIVDHINHNKLDNRKLNLRLVSPRESSYNHNQPIGSSGFRGVNRSKSGKRWEACISINNKQVYLGTYDTPEEAAKAYDKKVREIRTCFAITNF